VVGATSYSCSSDGLGDLNRIAKSLSLIDPDGKAAASDDCDSSGSAGVEFYRAGVISPGEF
jgi:hypothetical protein